MKKARIYKQLENKKVKCQACQWYCEIGNGDVGVCKTRLNKEGELYSLIYGILSASNVDPIEKKPLYHFYPGTEVLSIGSYGCNYRCKQCLNFSCSWGQPATNILNKLKEGKEEDIVRPEEMVDLAIERNIPGIAFTYNEPSIWPEYVYDVAKLAKEKGLYTVYVSNGSWTEESLNKLAPVIDACNIDIKGFTRKTYSDMGAYFGNVLKLTEKVVNEFNIFTELTTLVIPGINDSEEELENIANWITEKLGDEVPWHLSRFSPELAPDKDFQQIEETSVDKLRQAYKIGLDAGLKHVYVWAPSGRGSRGFAMGDTICPKCNKTVVERMGWQPDLSGLKVTDAGVFCKKCTNKLNVIL